MLRHPTRRGVAAASALCFFSATALIPVTAADLGGPRSRPNSPEPDSWVQNAPWTGFYLGATYGGGFGTSTTDTAVGRFDLSQSGGIASAFGGYDYQMGRTVFGLEADIGAGRLNGADNDAIGGRTSIGLSRLGSVRARAGFLLTPTLLAYATGGYAWSKFDLTSANGVTMAETFSGYQVGGGLQYKLSRQWDLKVEYLYTDFGAKTVPQNGLTNTYDPSYSTVRTGLSFKF